MSEVEWCYSFNEEEFEGRFKSKEDAIHEANFYYKDGQLDQKYIYVGQLEKVYLGVDAERIIEYVSENAYSQTGGDYAYDYLGDVTEQHERILEDRLNNVLLAWMKEFKYEPNFWTVKNIEKIEVNKYL